MFLGWTTYMHHDQMISGGACCDSVDNFLIIFSFPLLWSLTGPSHLLYLYYWCYLPNSSQQYDTTSSFTNWEVTELEASNYHNFVSHNLSDDILSCCDPFCLLCTSALDTACSEGIVSGYFLVNWCHM